MPETTEQLRAFLVTTILSCISGVIPPKTIVTMEDACQKVPDLCKDIPLFHCASLLHFFVDQINKDNLHILTQPLLREGYAYMLENITAGEKTYAA